MRADTKEEPLPDAAKIIFWPSIRVNRGDVGPQLGHRLPETEGSRTYISMGAPAG
jgi:hypothetical protein